MYTPQGVFCCLLLLLLALYSADALPRRNLGLTKRSNNPWSGYPPQDGLDVSLQSSASHTVQGKMAPVMIGTDERLVHSPIQQGFDLIPSNKGLVHTSQPFPNADRSFGHFGLDLQFNAGHNTGHHLGLGAKVEPQRQYHQIPPFYQAYEVNGGLTKYPSSHFGGSSQYHYMGNQNQGIHEVGPGSVLSSLGQIGQNSPLVSSNPNQNSPHTATHYFGLNHDSQISSSHNNYGGFHSHTPGINILASSIQHIIGSHLESTVQQNQAAHAAFSNLPQPCQGCGLPSIQTPEITHHIHIGQPQIITGTHVELINACSENEENCKSGPNPSIVNPLNPMTSNSGTTFSPPDLSKINGTELQENVNLEEVSDPAIVFNDNQKDLPIALEEPGVKHDDIDIRLGGENP